MPGLGCEPDSGKGILVVLVNPKVQTGELSRLKGWYKLSQAANQPEANPIIERAVHQSMELAACNFLRAEGADRTGILVAEDPV